MPELPEVEILARHLAPLLRGRVVVGLSLARAGVVRDGSAGSLREQVSGARLTGVTRRGKYLVIGYRPQGADAGSAFLVHLGMTGRMYVRAGEGGASRHEAARWTLEGGRAWIFEDPRRFGRILSGTGHLERLGPEPLGPGFRGADLVSRLSRTRRSLKEVLLDQAVVAGLGNIYVSEALFGARVHPGRRACELRVQEVFRLHRAIRRVLTQAIALGGSLELDFEGRGGGEPLFYFGTAEGSGRAVERFQVYGREGEACRRCRGTIQRVVQTGRSTYFCGRCQR